MSTPGQHPSSSSRDLTLVVESASGTPEEYFAQVALSLGRAKSNTIHIDHPDVDHIHAKVVKREESFWLQCEGQATLQVLDPEPGERGEVELIPGLTIELGGVTIRCRRQMRGMMGSSDNYWAAEVGGETLDVDAPGFKGVLPKKIGPYEIRKYVARGGMGIVLQGLHEETAHLAAVKLPTPDLNRNEQWLSRFEKEVQTLKKLVHPNLVRLQDAGKEGDLQWLAMDWVEGSTVAQKLSAYKKDNQPMPLPEIKMILKQVVEGLQYLHSKKVVHRDLKPANLLMGQDEGVKVADFGLAKQVDGDRSTFMTQTGTLAGTMYYMAPEQAEGLEVTAAADIYAFGVIWHELLTAKKPGVGTLKIRKFRPDCPSGWGEIIAQCLDSEPEDRPGLSRIKQVLEAEAFASDIEDQEEVQRRQKAEDQRKQREEAQRKEQERRRVEQAAKRKAEMELLAVLESQKKLEKSTQQERRKKEEEKRKKKEAAGMPQVKSSRPATPDIGEKKNPATQTSETSGNASAQTLDSYKSIEYPDKPEGTSTAFKVIIAGASIVVIGIVFLMSRPTPLRIEDEFAQAIEPITPAPATPLPVKPTPVTPPPAGAFVNTLGMKFVSVPGTDVQFSMWETRVKDYAAYAAANSGVDGEMEEALGSRD